MGNKASLSYCSVCYDGRYYSEDIMSDDIDAIICKDREDAAHIRVANDKQQYVEQHQKMPIDHLPPPDYSSALTTRSASLRSASPSGLGLGPSHSNHSATRRTVTGQHLLNQLSFSSQLSMEGRELCMNRRGASTCERDDVEDDVMMQRSESVLLPEDEEDYNDDGGDDMDRTSEARLPTD